MISRRGLLTGFAGVLAAPAIVRASSLMPVSGKAVGEPTFSELVSMTLRNNPDVSAQLLKNAAMWDRLLSRSIGMRVAPLTKPPLIQT